jgi:O-antigen ligase
MLSLALPIALVGIMRAKRWGPRLWYCLAACLLLAAMASTYRKSSLIAPVSVVATLVYFRPRQMLKMAPLAVVMLGAIHVAAPGAFGSVTEQLNSNRLNVPTVSDRVNRYDAVRPDLWSHLAFGRGMGTYDHVAHRILDSEVLDRLIETGILGLISYMMMMVATVLVARRVIRTRGPTAVGAAMMGAAASVSFIVVSTLYDTLEFPHAPYLFLCMAGLVAVVSTQSEEEPAEPSSAHEPRRRLSPGPLLRSSREMRGTRRVVRS